MSAELPGKLFGDVFRRLLANDLSEALRAGHLADGLDLDALQPVYPRAAWYRAIDRTAAALYPGDRAAGLRRLGQHIITTLHQRNVIKGPWLALARLLGPRRALKQAAGHLGNAPVKVTIIEKGRTGVEILVDDLEQPDFLAGLFDGAIALLGGREAHASVLGPRGGVMAFDARWR